VFEGAAESGRIELTGIERNALAAADFEVPRGFVIVSLDQGMLSSLGALAGPGADPQLRGLPALQGLKGLKGLPPGLQGLPGMPVPGSAGPAAPPPPKTAK
jgi:hypothetical protein